MGTCVNLDRGIGGGRDCVTLPFRPPLYRLVPKGRRDCGDHAWYNEDDKVEHCLHCRAERPFSQDHFSKPTR
jgi:hypothetical protein